MTRKPSSWKLLALVAVCLALFATAVFSGEWRPNHRLLPPAGSPNLEAPYPPSEVFLAGPDKPADQPAWLENLRRWRQERLFRLRYDGSQYDRPELAWTRHIFTQAQVLVWDRYLYDPVERKYTVEHLLNDLEQRYGHIDAVLLWPTYPNLGMDNRNQYDLTRDLPGGLPALRQAVEEFHRHGTKVFFPAMAWDQGTRDEGAPPWEALSKLLADVDADGINADTLESVPREFRLASDRLGHPLALEPQFDIRDESIAWSNLSWNDWVAWENWSYPFVPMVSKTKWFEPRHMVDVTDRFTRDKTDSLQHAFFNGLGYAITENLWGFWYEMIPRDAEALRRFTTIERAFADLLTGPGWEPHAPTVQPGVFASMFSSNSETLWTIVNRNEHGVSGEQLLLPHRPGTRYYDLWHGIELQPRMEGSQAGLSFEIGGLGYGAVLAVAGQPLTPERERLLAEMHQRSEEPLSAYSREWTFLPQEMVAIAPTKPVAAAPPGMVRVPGGDYDFKVRSIAVEGGNDPGVDVQYPWEDSPRRTHRHRMEVHGYYIDRFPVTNAEFKKFLDATHYHPADDHNFLRDWKNGTYPDGWGNKPVNWVSLEDARAYAAWAGKRLPHEWEWQYAAQGADGRIFPWGNEWKSDAAPPADDSRDPRPPSDVDAHPAGASPFGVMDMTGNLSEWTDEFQDDHTRAAIVRGGSYYLPRGSMWYFPRAYRLDEHHKYLLMAPSRDRSASIGFRCVADAP